MVKHIGIVENTIDPDTGLDKALFSAPLSEKTLKSIKELNESGDVVKNFLATPDSLDSELDDAFANYFIGLSNYVETHASHEFTGEKYREQHGKKMLDDASKYLKFAHEFTQGSPDIGAIQYLYTIKASMETDGKDVARLVSYIASKKEELNRKVSKAIPA